MLPSTVASISILLYYLVNFLEIIVATDSYATNYFIHVVGFENGFLCLNNCVENNIISSPKKQLNLNITNITCLP